MWAATRLGIPVYRPVHEHGRVDLVLDVGGRFWGVQCKWGNLNSDATLVSAHLGTCRRASNGYVRRTYDSSEIDLFAVYCGELDRCFLLPISRFEGLSYVHLRLTPARNGQVACTNLADSFDFEGAIAQLGERRHGMAEVVGSSPTSSTSRSDVPVVVGSNPFRDRLGYWLERVASGEEVVVTYHGKPRVRLTPVEPPPEDGPGPADSGARSPANAARRSPANAAPRSPSSAAPRSPASAAPRSPASAGPLRHELRDVEDLVVRPLGEAAAGGAVG